MSGRLAAVVRREYLERVRSKAFVVGTVLAPLLMGAFTIVPGLIFSRHQGKAVRIEVVDASGGLQAPAEQALAARTEDGRAVFEVRSGAGEGPVDETRARLKEDILAGRLDAYLYLPPDAIERSAAEYHGRNVGVETGAARAAVGDALVRLRLTREGLDPERIEGLTRGLSLKPIRVSASGDREDRGSTMLLAMVLMMMLYVTVAMWGAALMNGVIEEKTNRVVEVIVSSVSPARLLAGKLLGVGAVGLTQFLVWVGFMAALGAYSAAAAASGGTRLPEIPPALMGLFVVYFLLGYFLYASLYAAVGAAVNSPQEAQSLVFPVLLPLISAMVVFPAVLKSPESAVSTAMSLFPFWTPLLMFLRISMVMPPAWQVVLSIVLTALTIVAMNWIAARIYRVGILMYGKRPTFPEILRWVRVG